MKRECRSQREQVGLAIWRKVSGRPETEWRDLTDQEKGHALDWADAAGDVVMPVPAGYPLRCECSWDILNGDPLLELIYFASLPRIGDLVERQLQGRSRFRVRQISYRFDGDRITPVVSLVAEVDARG